MFLPSKSPLLLLPFVAFASCFFAPANAFGQAQLPAPVEWAAPAGAPKPPGATSSDVNAFFAPTGTVVAGAPVIAEWNRVVKPDESFTMTGQRFTALDGDNAGSDTTVWVLASSGQPVLQQAALWSVSDNLLTATIPADLPHGVFFVWVENDNGVSAPIALNRAEADWIGPLGNEVAPGSRKRVFGKNLSKEHGETESFVFARPVAGGSFLTLAVTGVEPYAVEFEVPASMAQGDYELIVHNGHGGEFGFSNTLPFTVKKPWARSAKEIVVASTGSDDTEAIQKALNELGTLPDGGTLRLMEGSYTTFGTIFIPAKVRIQGAGKGKTIVEANIQRSKRFTALHDKDVKPPRWAASFNEWVTPAAKLDPPVRLGDGPLVVSYAYKFKMAQGDWWFRPIVRLDGPDKTALVLWVNQSGRIQLRKDGVEGVILAEAEIGPLPLDTYVDVQWRFVGNQVEVTVNGRQELSAQFDAGGFDEITGIALMGVAHKSIADELPLHFIADLKVQSGDRVAFADDFSNHDISPAWEGVQDGQFALQATGDHLEISGITLTSRSGHLGLNDYSHLRIHDVALIDAKHGTASGRINIFGTHVEISNCDVGIIDPVDQHASADYWFHGNRIIGEVLPSYNHAGVYPNGRRGVIERNHFHNDWPEGKMTSSDNFIADFKSMGPTPWLSRVLLVGGRSGKPRMFHHYVGHNTCKGVFWQGNVAELILLHSLTHGWYGPVVASDGLTLKLGLDGVIDGEVRGMARRESRTGGPLKADTGDDGDHVMVIEGTGFGQIRRVMAHGEDTITIDKPWRVEPDSTSLIAIAPMSGNNIIYKNMLEAVPEGYVMKTHSASTGVSLYGNTFANFVEGNQSRWTRSGRALSGEANRPSWWNELRDEVAENMQGGEGLNMMLREEAFSPTAVGNTFKNIKLGNAANAIKTMSWLLKPTSRPDALPKIAVGNIFERINSKANGSGIVEMDDGKYGVDEPVRIYETLYRNNAFTLKNVEPGVVIGEKSGAVFAGNAFPDLPGDPISVAKGGEFQASVLPMHRAVRLSGSEPFELPLFNTAFQEQSWKIQSNAPWIVVKTPASGSLPAQSMSEVNISIDSAKLPNGTKRGNLVLESAGQKILIGVYPR